MSVIGPYKKNVFHKIRVQQCNVEISAQKRTNWKRKLRADVLTRVLTRFHVGQIPLSCQFSLIQKLNAVPASNFQNCCPMAQPIVDVGVNDKWQNNRV